MAAISKNVYIDKSPEKVSHNNKTPIKMKPVDLKSDTYDDMPIFLLNLTKKTKFRLEII